MWLDEPETRAMQGGVGRRILEDSDASARDRLIDAGEALFALHGFNGASLRQICGAAGARNNFAVQYHFGNLENFARAIVESRAATYEMHRGALLAEVMRSKPLTPRIVIEILHRPIIDHLDAAGEPLGARFMVALQNAPWGWRPLSELTNSPITQQLLRLMEELIPDLPPPVIWQRLFLTSSMIMNCAAQMPKIGSEDFHRAVIENAFVMAAAGLEAPLDQTTAHAMTELHRQDWLD